MNYSSPSSAHSLAGFRGLMSRLPGAVFSHDGTLATQTLKLSGPLQARSGRSDWREQSGADHCLKDTPFLLTSLHYDLLYPPSILSPYAPKIPHHTVLLAGVYG